MIVLRPMLAADWSAVGEIYRAGIGTGNATFETEPPTWDAWDASHLPGHRLVAELIDGSTGDDRVGLVIGWAALSPVSDRCAYRGVAENSVYVAARARGTGVGRMLLERLVADAEESGIWTVQTGIFPENHASVALHQRCGFRIVGTRERIGRLDGRWRDTLLLERRSGVAGV